MQRLFVSYAWSEDSAGRSNRGRVRALADQMSAKGWSVWLDADSLAGGSIDAAIVDGIELADVVVVCVTASYCDKVQRCCATCAAATPARRSGATRWRAARSCSPSSWSGRSRSSGRRAW